MSHSRWHRGDEIQAHVHRYVILSKAAAVAVALWVLHSFLFDAFTYSPRLLASSPEKRCGKSMLLRLIAALCCRPLSVENITSAAMFRSIEKFKPTLLLDEGDCYLSGKNVNEELRGLVNAGFARGGTVIRCVGDDAEPKAFGVFAPVAIGMIGKPPGTVEDRSILIPMRRKLRTEAVQQPPPGRSLREVLAPTTQRLVRWSTDNRDALGRAVPVMPQGLDDRAADCWYSLLAIADSAGGRWPQAARDAALELSAGRDAADSTALRLLVDLHGIFTRKEAERLKTDTILGELVAMQERPWGDYRRGRAITAQQVARLLAPFDVEPKLIRFPSGPARGFTTADLEDAWVRYMPDATKPTPGPVTSVTALSDNDLRTPKSVTPGNPVTGQGVTSGPACNGVTGSNRAGNAPENVVSACQQTLVTGVTGQTPENDVAWFLGEGGL